MFSQDLTHWHHINPLLCFESTSAHSVSRRTFGPSETGGDRIYLFTFSLSRRTKKYTTIPMLTEFPRMISKRLPRLSTSFLRFINLLFCLHLYLDASPLFYSSRRNTCYDSQTSVSLTMIIVTSRACVYSSHTHTHTTSDRLKTDETKVVYCWKKKTDWLTLYTRTDVRHDSITGTISRGFQEPEKNYSVIDQRFL